MGRTSEDGGNWYDGNRLQMKLCLSCMRKIPLLAGRCPYCLDQDQGVHGRFIFLLLLVVALIVGGNYYLEHKNDSPSKKELIELLEE